MSGEYNTAIQNLAKNVQTMSAQLAQVLTEQNVAQLMNVINNQFTNINANVATNTANISTLQSYVNMFPVPNFVDQEIPSGAINGTNATFNMAHNPTVGTVHLWYGQTATGFGQLLLQSVHYTIAGQIITINPGFIPNTGDWLRADYRY